MTTDIPSPRWFEHRTPEQRAEYAERFVRISARGEDIDGEARFVDAMAGRGSTILDAGCGTGRVAAALVRAGHHAVGVDADPVLIARGRELYPEVDLAVADLATISGPVLDEAGLPASYDVIVCPGNVLHFLAPGTEPRVVANLASLLRPGGRVAFGFFATDRPYTPELLDADAEAAGLVREHRFADWELRPWRAEADWAVSVHTRPG